MVGKLPGPGFDSWTHHHSASQNINLKWVHFLQSHSQTILPGLGMGLSILMHSTMPS